jgi:hypothetical protein
MIVIEGKLDTSTGQLLIPVRLDDARLWCSLDSGFSALIAVDREQAARAGLAAAREAPPSPGETNANAMLNVGGISIGDRSIIIRRLAGEAPDMQCIMGVAVLRRFVVEMDYAAARVRLHERAAYRAPANAKQIPLIFRTNLNVPFVQIMLTFADGTQRMAQVVPDTGTSNYAGLLVPTVVASVRAKIPRIVSPPQKPDSSRPGLRFMAGRLAAVSLGPFTMQEPVFALIEAGLNGGGIDDGTIGAGFFSRFTVSFDFDGRAMYLEPNPHFSERHLFDASGVSFRRSAEGYEVDVVLPESPASRAGLSEGDRLVDIDGRAPQTFTPLQLREYFSRPGETCALRVRRNGEERRLTLRLEDRL